MEQFGLTDGEKLIGKDDGILWGKGIANSMKGVLLLTSERLIFAQKEKNSLSILFKKLSGDTDYRIVQDLPLARVDSVRYITQGTAKSIITIMFGGGDNCFFCELKGTNYDWVSIISNTKERKVAC